MLRLLRLSLEMGLRMVQMVMVDALYNVLWVHLLGIITRGRGVSGHAGGGVTGFRDQSATGSVDDRK